MLARRLDASFSLARVAVVCAAGDRSRLARSVQPTQRRHGSSAGRWIVLHCRRETLDRGQCRESATADRLTSASSLVRAAEGDQSPISVAVRSPFNMFRNLQPVARSLVSAATRPAFADSRVGSTRLAQRTLVTKSSASKASLAAATRAGLSTSAVARSQPSQVANASAAASAPVVENFESITSMDKQAPPAPGQDFNVVIVGAGNSEYKLSGFFAPYLSSIC